MVQTMQSTVLQDLSTQRLFWNLLPHTHKRTFRNSNRNAWNTPKSQIQLGWNLQNAVFKSHQFKTRHSCSNWRRQTVRQALVESSVARCDSCTKIILENKFAVWLGTQADGTNLCSWLKSLSSRWTWRRLKAGSERDFGMNHILVFPPLWSVFVSFLLLVGWWAPLKGNSTHVFVHVFERRL